MRLSFLKKDALLKRLRKIKKKLTLRPFKKRLFSVAIIPNFPSLLLLFSQVLNSPECLLLLPKNREKHP